MKKDNSWGSVKFVFCSFKLSVIRVFTIALLLFALLDSARAQLLRSPERAAIRHMEKGRWLKAESILRKEIRQEPVHALGKYLMSRYFFTPPNPGQHLDSAYRYAVAALADLAATSPKDLERIHRFPLDSATITGLRQQIDSAIFEVVRTVHSESAYIRFLTEHPFAVERDEAIKLRNEVAYLNAIQKNTYEAFLEFLNKYPLADQAPEARTNYERLLYEARTADKKLSSYEGFLREHPETPFRPEIEQNIFELFTLSGEAERFVSFSQLYPKSQYARKARNLLFHILEEEDDTQAAGLFLNDSLRHIRSLQASYLVPFFKNRKFGLMDKNGVEVMQPVIDDLTDEYKCGNIAEDIIVMPDRVVARDGNVVYSGSVKEIDDLGTGFLKLTTDRCTSLVHKSGFTVEECISDAKVLGKRFLIIREEDGWTLRSLVGRELMPDFWNEIDIHGQILALRKEEQWQLITVKSLTEFTQRPELLLTDPYDELKFLPEGKLWVRNGQRQGILDQALSRFIPLGDYEVESLSFGYSATSSKGVVFFNRKGKRSVEFAKVAVLEPWVLVNNDSLWHLFDVDSVERQDHGYDSIAFEGPFFLGYNADSVTIHFPGLQREVVGTDVKLKFMPGKDSTSFLIAEVNEKKNVYDLHGRKLFAVSFDEIHHAGQDLFIVSRKEKKGLLDSSGKLLLPVEFDAIGSLTNNVISLLKSMKFGLYHPGHKKLIKPQYDKNLIPYRADLIAAFRDGYFGFIDWENKTDEVFQFDEVKYWNDTVALVRQQTVWSLYHMGDRFIVQPDIREIHFISDTPEEKLAIVHTGSAFGVLSNRRGTVIPITFTDLVNVGSSEEPLYFTEKHVPEASVFVVIYYDRMGAFLRREVYEETEDYERIYCSEH